MATFQDAPTIFDTRTCLQRGRCRVAENARAPQPHELYYELHGDKSPEARRIIFIMGLSNSCFGWSNQVKYFASKSGYQVLVFDNRGVGLSDSPKGAYKTSEMAMDVVELLHQVGWVPKDEESNVESGKDATAGGATRRAAGINVVGVSMGGMIGLELATMIPSHIASLCLTSTKSGTAGDFPKPIVLSTFAKILSGVAATPEKAIPNVVTMLFPQAYLAEARESDPEKRTNRQVLEKEFLMRFNMTRKQTMGGRLGQLAAVFTHKVSNDRLAKVDKAIPRIAIITGDDDNLVNPQRSKDLHEAMPSSTLDIIEGAGHALPSQIADHYNAWVEGVILREPTRP